MYFALVEARYLGVVAVLGRLQVVLGQVGVLRPRELLQDEVVQLRMLQVLRRRIGMVLGLVEEMLQHFELLNWDYHRDVTLERRLGVTLIC